MTHLKVIFKEGIPSSEQEITEFAINEADRQHFIVVFDDLMSSVCDSNFLEKLFTVTFHHYNITCFYMSQNIFCKGKNARTISLQFHYMILMRSKRDQLQVQCLARQIYPSKSKNFMKIYLDATSEMYGMLLVDVSPHSKDELRLRTNILPDQQTIVYDIDNVGD